MIRAKLLEDFEHLKNVSRDVESVLTKLTESHEQLKSSYLQDHAMFPSPLDIMMVLVLLTLLLVKHLF